MGIFSKSIFAKLGLCAVGATTGALLTSGSVFAEAIPNSAFSTSNLVVYQTEGGKTYPEGAEMPCNNDFGMEFDYTIESERPLAAGDTLATNMVGPALQSRIPVGLRGTAPIAIKNQSGQTVATWELADNGILITIKEAGAGLQSLSGHINTGRNLNTATCTTVDLENEQLKVDWTNGAGPQDTRTVKLLKGSFRAQNQHTVTSSLSSLRVNSSVYTPNQTINSLYRSNGRTALSSSEIIKDLWIEVQGSEAFDSYSATIYARATIPAGSVGTNPNMEGGVSGNGQNIEIKECGNGKAPCKQELVPNDGETKEAFVQRLREAQGDQAIIPYGRYGDRVIVYFGDIPNSNQDMTFARIISNDKASNSDFTDRRNPYHPVEIWQAVDEAVGPTNVIGGKAVYYNASIRMMFAQPLGVSGQQVTTTTDYHYLDGDNAVKHPDSITVSKNVSIGSSEVAVEKGTASLQLIDADSKAPIAGAQFKLQKQDGSSWTDVANATRTTGDDGKLQVISLDDGTYRWVQTSYAADYYEQSETPYYENTTLSTPISSFEISDQGYAAAATNKRKSYTVTFAGGEHAASDFTNIVKTQLYGEATITPSSDSIKGATGWIFDGWDKNIADKVTEDATYTATWKQEQTTIRGRIVWLDANNEDGIRPDSVGVNAVQDGHTLDRSAHTDENGLFEIDQMNKYDAYGNLIDYSVFVRETGYTTEIEKNDNGTLTVYLSHSPQTTITINKVWDDKNYGNAMRPETITFNLMADGRHTGTTVTLGKNDTSASIENVAKYSDLSGNGTPINYSISENATDFYDIKIIKDSAYVFTVTNTLQDPAAVEHSFTVTASVEDGALDNGRSANLVLTPVSDGAPMPSDSVDGKKTAPVGDAPNVGLGSVTFDEAGDYQYKITLETNPATIGDENGNNEFTVTVKVKRDPETNALVVESEEYTDANGNQVHPKDVSFTIGVLDPTPLTEDVTIQLPVDGDIEEGKISATITGKDNAPMPSDAEDGKTNSLVNPDGSINLGDITFTEPGEYEYGIKLNSDEYDIDVDEFTIVVKVKLDEATNTLYVDGIVAVDADGNEISLEDLGLGIRRREEEISDDSANPNTSAKNYAPAFAIVGATIAALGCATRAIRRR